MSKKARLFELMSKRETLLLRKKAQELALLEAEKKGTDEICKKLEEMKKDNAPGSGLLHPRTLYAKSWYGAKLQEQHEVSQARSEFLKQETQNMRVKMSHHQRKESLLAQKTSVTKAQARDEREKKAEALMAPRMNKQF